MTTTLAYAAQAATTALAPFSIERRAPGPDDVQIDILYCGVCHSDLHTARSFVIDMATLQADTSAA